MRRSVLVAIALLFTAVLTVYTALGTHGAQRTNQVGTVPPGPPGGGTPIIGTPFPVKGQHSFRSLTKRQRAQILRIAEADKTFKRLAGKRKYKISAVTLWSKKDGSPLGGLVSVRFKTSSTISGTWLDLDYDCTEKSSPPYGKVPYKAQYVNVTWVTLFVDTKRKQVVGIKPLGSLVGKAKYPPAFKSRTAATCSTSSGDADV
jgi:hypothetical protein